MKWIKGKLKKLGDQAQEYTTGELLWIAVVAFWGGVLPVPGLATVTTLCLSFFLLEKGQLPFAILILKLVTPLQFLGIPLFARVGVYLNMRLGLETYLEGAGIIGLIDSLEAEEGSWLMFGIEILKSSSAALLAWLVLTPFVFLGFGAFSRQLGVRTRSK